MDRHATISETNVVQATDKHTATVFFFHGSGDTAEDMKEWVDLFNSENVQFSHIKLVFPSAPLQPYTPYGRMMRTIWFDRLAFNNKAPEHLKSIDSMCKSVSKLIDKEVSNGIPLNRIILGGFSMGGCFALHLAYRYKTDVAGCFVMSSFLNKGSVIYEHLKANPEHSKVPLIQFHGKSDTMVPIEWGEETAKNLTDVGVNVKFVPLKDLDHELSCEEMQKWQDWLLSIFPDESLQLENMKIDDD